MAALILISVSALQVLLVALNAAVSHWMLCRAVNARGSFLHPAELVYLGGFVALEVYCTALHSFVFGTKLPFLPLLLVSVYSALGVSYVWLCMAIQWLPIHVAAAKPTGHKKLL